MSAPIYGLEALHRYREDKAAKKAAAREPEQKALLLDQIPADAPMEDATITAWDGERFVAWEKWRATTPIAIEEIPRKPSAPAIDLAKQTHPRNPDVQEGLW